jgi:hypothetical protein
MLLALLQTATQAAISTASPSGGSRDDLIKGLAAGALGLIGTVATLLYGWVKDRDTLATRTKQLDEASKRISFWDNWYKAISPLDSGNDSQYWRERARTEMWFTSVTIGRLFHQEAQKATTLLPKWRRWLLFYAPPRSRAWIPRVLFYFYLFLGPLSIPLQFHLQRVRHEEYIANMERELKVLQADKSANPAITKDRVELQSRIDFDKAQPFMGGTTTRVFYEIVMGLLCAAFSLLFRWWSVSLEKIPNPTITQKPT